MKKIFISIMLVLWTCSVFAQDIKDEKIKNIKETFQETFEMEIESLKELDIPDLYEIETDEGILYYHLPTRTIFVGALIRDGINLTEKSLMEKSEKFIKEAEKEAILVSTGKNKVILVTDPDCPFCKKVDNFLKNKDVELRVILYPLKQIHPYAEKKVAYIFDSQDKAKAYKEVMEGKVDANKISQEVVERQKTNLLKHEEITKKLKVRGTPALWVNGKRIDGADLQEIENNLKN